MKDSKSTKWKWLNEPNWDELWEDEEKSEEYFHPDPYDGRDLIDGKDCRKAYFLKVLTVRREIIRVYTHSSARAVANVREVHPDTIDVVEVTVDDPYGKPLHRKWWDEVPPGQRSYGK